MPVQPNGIGMDGRPVQGHVIANMSAQMLKSNIEAQNVCAGRFLNLWGQRSEASVRQALDSSVRLAPEAGGTSRVLGAERGRDAGGEARPSCSSAV